MPPKKGKQQAANNDVPKEKGNKNENGKGKEGGKDQEKSSQTKEKGKGKGNDKDQPPPPPPSAKAIKLGKKAQRAADEQARLAEQEAMMNIVMSESEEEEYEEEDDDGNKKGKLTDSFGNTIVKGSATDPEVVKLRAEKTAAREAKKAASSTSTSTSSKSKDTDIDALLAKQLAGTKLSNKERKLIKKKEDRAARMVEEEVEANDNLKAFRFISLSHHLQHTSILPSLYLSPAISIFFCSSQYLLLLSLTLSRLLSLSLFYINKV